MTLLAAQDQAGQVWKGDPRTLHRPILVRPKDRVAQGLFDWHDKLDGHGSSITSTLALVEKWCCADQRSSYKPDIVSGSHSVLLRHG